MFEVVDDGAYFGSHAPFGEMPFFVVAPGFTERDGSEVPLIGCVVIEKSLLHGCRYEQEVGMQCSGQKTGGQVLVNDALDARKVSCLILHNGDTTTADGYDNKATLNEGFYSVTFDDLLGLRRWHNTAPATACILDHSPALLSHLGPGFLFFEERAYGLAGIVHGRIIFIVQHLGDDRHALALDTAARKFVVQGLLNHIANSALRISPAGIERHGMQHTSGVF